jgi:hypothetical protein
MKWLVVALAIGALLMGLRAANHWRDSSKDQIDPNVAWWTAAAFILGGASAIIGILISK